MAIQDSVTCMPTVGTTTGLPTCWHGPNGTIKLLLRNILSFFIEPAQVDLDLGAEHDDYKHVSQGCPKHAQSDWVPEIRWPLHVCNIAGLEHNSNDSCSMRTGAIIREDEVRTSLLCQRNDDRWHDHISLTYASHGTPSDDHKMPPWMPPSP